MKVVHITKLPDGGASWCAMRICRALRKQGIDAEMLLMQGQTSNHISIVEAGVGAVVKYLLYMLAI